MSDDATLSGLSVLMVDDDAELCELLADVLRTLGPDVQTAYSVTDAMARLDGPPFHLAILDVQLPDGSGFSIANHLRRHQPQTGVVMLTRLSEPSWQVAGFDIGADLYLPKPVSPDLLCAAVRSLAGRLFPRPDTSKSNDWRLYAPDGQWIALNPAERSLMRMLFSCARSVVTREDLLNAMTGDEESAAEQRLDVLIHRLRRKAETNGLPRLPLQSVRGQGYVLMLDAEADAQSTTDDKLHAPNAPSEVGDR